MHYCFSPTCTQPNNPDTTDSCQTCGASLQLANRYYALKLLGRGGFGRTFLAVDHASRFGVRCVIKQFFPPSGLQVARATRLFDQEAMRLAQLGQHPQIPYFLAHFTEHACQYLVQRYINGQTLEREVEQSGCLEEAQIRSLLNSLLPVLQFVHDRQIIHRDIKPANIIRRYQDGQLVLVDFGASKHATPDEMGQTGTVIGSAGYAAPEQLAGKAIYASDLYSLGVTCLFLLTHTQPFDLYSFSEGQWCWRDYLPCPVSASLGQILDRLVEPALNRRYAAAAQVLQDLNPRQVITISRPILSNQVRQEITHVATPASLSGNPWECVHTLVGHTSPIGTIAMHPQGKWLASGSFDKTIKLWNMQTGTLLETLTAHEGTVSSLVFTPDGSRLVSGSIDHTIRIWRLQPAIQEYVLTQFADAVMSLSLALSPDGQAIISGSDDHTIKLWQTSTGKRLRTIVQERAITAVMTVADGQTLVSGSSDNCIRLWNFCTGEWLYTLVGHQRDINSLAISADDRWLVSGSSDHTIKIWDLPARQLVRTLIGHLDWVKTVTVSPTAPILASGSSDHTIKIWDLLTGKLLQTLVGHNKDVNALAFTADGQTLVSAGGDRILKVWQRDASGSIPACE